MKIETKAQYKKALARFEEVFQAKRGPKSKEANQLAKAIEKYESKKFPELNPQFILSEIDRLEDELGKIKVLLKTNDPLKDVEDLVKTNADLKKRVAKYESKKFPELK